MNKILVRYNEIYLKGKNRHIFEKLLKDNIAESLKDLDCQVTRIPTRVIIENYDLQIQNKIVNKVRKVLGVHSISVAKVVETNVDVILAEALKSVTTTSSFRVSVRRADKSFSINSLEFAKQVGGHILQNKPGLRVDLYHFDQEISIEIREDKSAYIFSDSIKCCGGLPVGCSSKGMLMLSGGIDSPVSGYMMAKRGMKLCGLHFHSYPYTSKMALEKVGTLGEKLNNYVIKMPLYVVPFTEIQEAIHKNCASELMIILMRRFMMRIANAMCEKTNCKAIITGENLAQVASQTVESITCTNIIAKVPVFRPLIGFDKVDIIDIAKDIDTYNSSILPYEDCCTVFLPKKPVIKPKLDIILAAEKKLDIQALVDNAVNKTTLYED